MLETTSSFDRFTPLSTLIKSGDYSEKDIGTAVIMRASNATAEFKNDVWQLVELFEDLKKWDAWKYTGRKSLEEFCSEFFGRTVDAVQKLGRTVHEMKERGLVDFGADSVERYSNGRQIVEVRELRKHDNYHDKQQGTSADYWASRLKRDAPDYFEAWKRGGYRSVRAACIAAGLIDPPKTTTVRCDDIKRAVDTLLKHYDLDALRDEINLR